MTPQYLRRWLRIRRLFLTLRPRCAACGKATHPRGKT